MPRGVDRWDEARHQGRLWDPRGDGLAVWYDADDIGTITCDGSGNVSEWRDKSGNANHASQGTGVQRPAFQGANVYGKPGLRFTSASSNFLEIATALAVGDTTVTVAFRHLSSAGTQTLVASNLILAGSHQCRINGDRISQVKNFVTEIQAAGSGAAPPINHIWTWRSSSGGGTWLMRDDGTDYTTTSSQTIDLGTKCLGQSRGSEFFNGIMCETIISLGKATDYQVVRREGYLAWKWGFANILRGDHPYKNRPPLIGD